MQTFGQIAPFQSQQEASRTAAAVTALTELCHAANATWWTDLKTGEDLRVSCNAPEKLMLCVSELSEAMEGHRKNLMDDKLPHRRMVEVELADSVIRIFDLAGAKGYDIAGALVEKLQYNAGRADHKPANRAAAGGKAY